MSVLMLSLMYPEDMKTQVARDAKDKLQNQINSYQRSLCRRYKGQSPAGRAAGDSQCPAGGGVSSAIPAVVDSFRLA